MLTSATALGKNDAGAYHTEDWCPPRTTIDPVEGVTDPVLIPESKAEAVEQWRYEPALQDGEPAVRTESSPKT